MLLKRNKILFFFIFLLLLGIILFTFFSIKNNSCYKKLDNFILFVKLDFKCFQSNSISLGQYIFSIQHHYSEFFRYRSTNFKKKKVCGLNKKVILVIGQSNSANEVKSFNYKKNNNLNFFNGNCYVLSSPALGTTGQGDNISPAISNYLEEENYIFVTLGWSGTSILDWGSDKYSYLSSYVKSQLDMFDFKQKIDFLIWIQGETDAKIFKKLDLNQGPAFFQTYGRDRFYYESFKILHKDLEKYFYKNTKFIMTSSTKCNSAKSDFINYQRELISKISNNFYLLKETDSLDDSHRYDKCHLNEKGVDITAKSISNVINLAN